MKGMKALGIKLCLLLGLSLGSTLARAVSQGDKYISLVAGLQPREKKFEATLLGGRSFFDEFGAGAFVDFLFNGYQAGAEFRWFFEPFEVSLGLGTSYSNLDKKNRALFIGSAAYLWALTHFIALKVDFRGQFYIHQKSTLYTSVGVRIVF